MEKNAPSQSKRGRFRNVDMTTLQKSALDPYWDDERAQVSYGYPLPTDNPAQMRENAVKLSQIPPQREIYEIGPFLVAGSPESHIGPFKWAEDFLVFDGTRVLAVNDGVVTELEESCTLWGDDPKFRDYLNYVTIKHANGEFSQYCHLEPGSATRYGIQVGSQVLEGQSIALVGKTGWTDRDHLHFIVFRHDDHPSNPFGFKSLKVRFENI